MSGRLEGKRVLVTHAGHIDVLIAKFAGPPDMMPLTNMLGDVTEFEDEDFQAYLDELVWPLMRFVRATLPQMIKRGERARSWARRVRRRFAPSRSSVYTALRVAPRTPFFRSSAPRPCRSTPSAQRTSRTLHSGQQIESPPGGLDGSS